MSENKENLTENDVISSENNEIIDTSMGENEKTEKNQENQCMKKHMKKNEVAHKKSNFTKKTYEKKLILIYHIRNVERVLNEEVRSVF